MAPQTTPYTRVLWRGEVDNAQLVALCVRAARMFAARIRYDARLRRERLPYLAHQYVQRCTEYRKEGPDEQTVRAPWVFVRQRVGDCKTQAVFVALMCKAAGYPVQLRFVKLRPGPNFTHVYAIVAQKPVDPLLPYGTEPAHLSRLDVPI